MTKANSSHDLSFLKQDGTTEVGLMIWRDPNPSHAAYNAPMYTETDNESLAQQYFSGEPSYANLPP
jgi:hypothetical protein